MKHRSVFFSLIIVLSLANCTKDKTTTVNPPVTGCVQTDSVLLPFTDSLYTFPVQPPWGWQQVFARNFQYFRPCFSPADPNEFVYVRQDRSKTLLTCDLCVFNICTGKNRVLASNAYLGANPQWSVKNWIVYTGDDGDLWKIKHDGTGLTKLTIGPNFNYMAVWNPDGSKILFQQKTSGPNYDLVINEDGSIIDTLFELSGGAYWSWGLNNKISTPASSGTSSYGIGYFDLNQRSFVQLKAIDLSNNGVYCQTNCFIINCTQWFNKGKEIIYSSGCYITVIDTATKQTTVIRQGCENATFDYISVAPDEEKILAARTDQTLSDSTGANGLLNCERNIYLMNKDGSDLRKIKFPE